MIACMIITHNNQLLKRSIGMVSGGGARVGRAGELLEVELIPHVDHLGGELGAGVAAAGCGLLPGVKVSDHLAWVAFACVRENGCV